MTRYYDENVHFSSGLSVGNFAHGLVTMSPSSEEVTTVDVTGLNMEGTGDIFPQAQVYTQWPWHSCSIASVWTTVDEDPVVHLWDMDTTSFRICMKRTNNAVTNIGWCVWKAP